MKSGRPCPEKATLGSMATGEFAAIIMSGFQAFGNGRRTPAPTGAIRTTTTTSKAGRCTKATGIARTMATTTTIITITIAGTTITTIVRSDR